MGTPKSQRMIGIVASFTFVKMSTLAVTHRSSITVGAVSIVEHGAPYRYPRRPRLPHDVLAAQMMHTLGDVSLRWRSGHEFESRSGGTLGIHAPESLSRRGQQELGLWGRMESLEATGSQVATPGAGNSKRQ